MTKDDWIDACADRFATGGDMDREIADLKAREALGICSRWGGEEKALVDFDPVAVARDLLSMAA
ncbi:hypothetical protein Sp245p_25960 (plasmid) [Azospirillum baldaniorum]|uniref:Uncharacterized protein n=1 Tax=Azospirillum baldaniorum TaxID=1064539 RepID=A0A9P1JZR6_9PROT|nr:hypothetical protein [Azospirillum baldaniorum]AWJ93272.1 hypothetical protein Sp245p_25960 [Azospirillum baldaniorum]TWA77967.1 hypothetical protein FBZ85_106127 [Azospirillum brasilense]CCD02933.1 protein of unknown function [Azospirillum baldaniorum]